MLTRRNFLATGAGALAVTAVGGAAFAATTQTAPMVSIVSAQLASADVLREADVVLGADRLANLRDLRAAMVRFNGQDFDLTLDAADAMLFEIAAADMGRSAFAANTTQTSAGV